ncbi:hypothetical protein FA13DRAFT_1793946 [Coprinellus micaceus]|uniref:Uncharacterized protein n=1 Tax=Coprinellus micaceus TaxID=71717 RepID=A0A4Y7T382_COPMI|nr:hypothetical protein FA13DRAFT_1793946 [Coprinellus micaceus]
MALNHYGSPSGKGSSMGLVAVLRSFTSAALDDPRETSYRNTSFLHLPLSLTHLSLNLPWYTDFMGKAGDVLPYESLQHPWRQSGIPVEVWGEVFLEVIADTKLKAADQRHFSDAGVCLWEVERFLVEGPVLEKLALQADSMHSFQDIIDGIESLSLPTRDRAWDSLRSFALHICDWDDPEEGLYRRHTSFLHFPHSLTHLSLTLPWYLSFRGEESDFPPSISLPNLLHLYIECDWPTTLDSQDHIILQDRPDIDPQDRDPHESCWLTLQYKSATLRPAQPSYLTIAVGGLAVYPGKCLRCPEDESHWASIERYGDNIQASSQRSGSFVHLRHVRLHFPKERGGTVDLAPILRRLPSTTHLTIEDTNFEHTLFQQGSQLLPQLQFLELIGRQPAFDYVPLAQFCEERSSRQPGFTVSRSLISSADADDGWDIHA